MLRDPRVSTTASADAVVLSVDDGANAEYWMRLEISAETLLEWLGMILAQQEAGRTEMLALHAALETAWVQ